MSPLQAFRPPKLRAVGQFVGDHPGIAGRDELIAAGRVDHDRRGPGIRHGAVRSQTVLPVAMSSAMILRLFAFGFALIHGHEEQVAEGGQRGGVAVEFSGTPRLRLQTQLAVEIEGRHVAVGENGKRQPAVGRHGRRGVADVLHLAAACCSRPWRAALPPQQLAVGGVEAIDLAAVPVGPGEKDAIAPDHRRAVARQADRRFPEDVLARSASHVSGTFSRPRCPSRPARETAATPWRFLLPTEVDGGWKQPGLSRFRDRAASRKLGRGLSPLPLLLATGSGDSGRSSRRPPPATPRQARRPPSGPRRSTATDSPGSSPVAARGVFAAARRPISAAAKKTAIPPAATRLRRGGKLPLLHVLRPRTPGRVRGSALRAPRFSDCSATRPSAP